MKRYILDAGGIPQPEPDLKKWDRWMENTNNLCVKNETIGDVRICTWFLGMDLSPGSNSPMLFETVVYGGAYHLYMKRYGNAVAALAGHDQAVAMVSDKVKEIS